MKGTGQPKGETAITATQADIDYCTDLVRQADPNRFRTVLFAGARRRHLFGLYAFHIEISRAPLMVSEPILARIRLQWWREVIDECFGSGQVRAHPVAAVLADVTDSADLPRNMFDEMIDAHGEIIESNPFKDLEQVEAWSGHSSGNLQALAARTLGNPVDEAALLVGTGYMLAGVKASSAGHLIHTDIADHTLTRARDLLGLAREKSIPRAVLPAFLIATLAEDDRPGGVKTQMQLLWRAMLGRF